MCTPGYFCSGVALPGPTGPCSPGYYCDGGASTPTQHETPAGYHTPGANSAPVPCDPGAFNTQTAQGDCR